MIWFLALGVTAAGLFGYLRKRMLAMEKRLEQLEQGVIPNHEQAKAAAAAVNDFHAGIAGILGYDPFDARKAAKE